MGRANDAFTLCKGLPAGSGSVDSRLTTRSRRQRDLVEYSGASVGFVYMRNCSCLRSLSVAKFTSSISPQELRGFPRNDMISIVKGPYLEDRTPQGLSTWSEL